MFIQPIKIYGSDILGQKSEPVEEMTDEIRALINNLRDSLYYHQGVGLAANQIGLGKRVFVADIGKGLMVCINPTVVEICNLTRAEEGCLSLPEIYLDIERSASLELEYRDENWQLRRREAEDLLARVIQHEIDHLDGMTIADRAGFLARKLIAGKLRRLEKRVRESL